MVSELWHAKPQNRENLHPMRAPFQGSVDAYTLYPRHAARTAYRAENAACS
jgi:hypothetical protein